MREVYLDNAATTKVRPEIAEAMAKAMVENYGNPSSIYKAAQRAATAIAAARQQVADLIGASPKEIIFTGGGSEGDNMLIKGVAHANVKKGRHIITTQVEHHAVLHTCEELAKEGFPAIVGPDLTSRNKIEVQNMSFKTAGVLNRAGVMVAITTDHPVSQIQTLPLCAGLAVKAGLPMEEGFRAITIYPAKICGVADRIGSLEVGKDADIAIFDGNPMEIFTRTLYTIINGEIVYCNVPRE
jgi:hypothetical protein